MAELKTSVRLTGIENMERFRAMCALLGRRPHELAHDFVQEGMRRMMADPEVGAAVDRLARSALEHRQQQEEEERQAQARRSGFRVISGGST